MGFVGGVFYFLIIFIFFGAIPVALSSLFFGVVGFKISAILMIFVAFMNTLEESATQR